MVIDRDRAADLGVDTEDIATALRLMVGGDIRVSRFRDPEVNEDYNVQLRLRETDRDDPQTLQRLYLPSDKQGLVRLDSVADVISALAPSRIDRLDRQRQVAVRGGVAPGFALADRLALLQAEAEGLGMPPTYSTMIAGRGRELQRTYGEFALAFLLSIVFMYMILAAQFENVFHPLTILFSLPIALPVREKAVSACAINGPDLQLGWTWDRMAHVTRSRAPRQARASPPPTGRTAVIGNIHEGKGCKTAIMSGTMSRSSDAGIDSHHQLLRPRSENERPSNALE